MKTQTTKKNTARPKRLTPMQKLRAEAVAPELFAVVQAVEAYGVPRFSDECRRLIAKVLGS